MEGTAGADDPQNAPPTDAASGALVLRLLLLRFSWRKLGLHAPQSANPRLKTKYLITSATDLAHPSRLRKPKQNSARRRFIPGQLTIVSPIGDNRRKNGSADTTNNDPGNDSMTAALNGNKHRRWRWKHGRRKCAGRCQQNERSARHSTNDSFAHILIPQR